MGLTVLRARLLVFDFVKKKNRVRLRGEGAHTEHVSFYFFKLPVDVLCMYAELLFTLFQGA